MKDSVDSEAKDEVRNPVQSVRAMELEGGTSGKERAFTYDERDGESQIHPKASNLSAITPELAERANALSLLDLRTGQIVHIVQYLCVLISGIGCIYFLARRFFFIALEYFQVWFISVLVIVLDHPEKLTQQVGFVFLILVAISWGSMYNYVNIDGLTGVIFVLMVLTTILMSAFFIAGMVYMAYVITQISSPLVMKCVELDLLLYLIALNAICFFSVNQFNYNLHMILDIRTLVMLFSGLHQEKDKMKLLRNPNFLAIMLLVVISFILFAIGYPVTTLMANCCYIFIGAMLIYETHLKSINRHVTKD